MKKHAIASDRRFSKLYLKKRMTELATAATRARTNPLAQWAVKRIRLEYRPFSFEGHEYLKALYDDTAQHIVLEKAAQIGGTVWALLRSIHACLCGLNVAYYFPTRSDVIEFSKSRVGPLLAENEFISTKMKDTDTAGLKQIGEAFIYFRGMQSTVQMKSIPVDQIVFDELDEAEPSAKALAKERLAHSDFKRIIELSNPSLPGYGVDEQFQKSDQRHWTLKCPSCGSWTALDKEFPKKLGQEVRIILPRKDGSYYRACPKCGGELDLAAGEWVPDLPGRKIHGYRISQLHSAKVDPGEILEEYRTTRYPDRFFNLKIGFAWSDLERRLDMMTVLSMCQDDLSQHSGGFNFMGVDTGRELHVVILRRHPDRPSYVPVDPQKPHQLIHLQTCTDFQELDVLMEKYDIRGCIIDGLPETHAARDFAHRHRGRTFLCFYNEHQRGKTRFDYRNVKVEVNRTESLDGSRAAFREKQVLLPRRCKIMEEFARHLTHDAKVLDEDEETGIKKFRYIKTGVNHFSMSFNYAWMAISNIAVPVARNS